MRRDLFFSIGCGLHAPFGPAGQCNIDLLIFSRFAPLLLSLTSSSPPTNGVGSLSYHSLFPCLIVRVSSLQTAQRL